MLDVLLQLSLTDVPPHAWVRAPLTSRHMLGIDIRLGRLHEAVGISPIWRQVAPPPISVPKAQGWSRY